MIIGPQPSPDAVAMWARLFSVGAVGPDQHDVDWHSDLGRQMDEIDRIIEEAQEE